MKGKKVTIQHDITEYRVIRVVAIVSTIVTIAIYHCVELCFEFAPTAVVALIGCAFYVMPFITLALWIYLLDTATYLKRLKKYGYEVPVKRKEYDNDLAKLPRKEMELPKEPVCKESLVLSWLCIVVSISALLFNIYLFWRYSSETDVTFFNIVVAVVMIFWILQARRFKKQSDNQKYRVDVELDSKRKIRTNLATGIAEIVILVFFMSYGFYMITCMIEYVICTEMKGDW